MAWYNNFLNLGNKIEKPNTLNGFVIDVGGKSKVLEEDYLKWYKTNPFVFTAINERAKAVASCKFYIELEDGELIENSITDKLNKPNKYLSRNEFLMQLMTYKGIWGTAYLYKNKLRSSSKFEDIDLINIPSNQIEFNSKGLLDSNYDYILDMLKFEDENKIKIKYVSLEGTTTKELDKGNLLTFLDTTIFTNPYYSESRLKSQLYVVSNIQAALESENTFLSTPAGMGMLVPDNKDASGVGVALRPEEKEELETALQNDYGTLAGQKNIRILNAPTKYIPTMVDISKLKLNESIIQKGLILFGAYGLPKELMTAVLSGSTFENQNVAYKNYIQGTAQNEVDSIANELNDDIDIKGGKLIASFDHLPIMQEDEDMRAKKLKTAAETLKINKEVYDDLLLKGYISDQEYKEKLGL